MDCDNGQEHHHMKDKSVKYMGPCLICKGKSRILDETNLLDKVLDALEALTELVEVKR